MGFPKGVVCWTETRFWPLDIAAARCGLENFLLRGGDRNAGSSTLEFSVCLILSLSGLGEYEGDACCCWASFAEMLGFVGEACELPLP